MVTNEPPSVSRFASSDEAVFQRTADCRRYFEYHPVLAFESGVKQFEEASLEDIGHSYAFSHLLHKDVAIYETFLAMYFRPNNYYCVHVDLKVRRSSICMERRTCE